MTYLLVIDSAITGPDSVSRPLLDEFAQTWLAAGADRTVRRRDLAADPVPHLTSAGQHYAPPMRRDHEGVDDATEELQRELIDEVAGAAAVIIAAPVYNYSMPSTLKAWLDHLHVLGVTTPAPGEDGPLAGIPVIAVSPRGLAYDNTDPAAAGDYALPPLEKTLGESLGMRFTGIPVDFTLATRMPPLAEHTETAAASLAQAREQLRRLAAEL